jgi:hypothetical protein
MFRGMTARTVGSLFVAVLFALQPLVPAASFATAHTARHTVAKAQPGIKLSEEALRDESATHRDSGALGEPTVPLRLHDRHRTADSAPDRLLMKACASTASEPATPRVTYHSASRWTLAHSPTALQVFRC